MSFDDDLDSSRDSGVVESSGSVDPTFDDADFDDSDFEVPEFVPVFDDIPADNIFTDELAGVSAQDWNIDADVIWGVPDVAIDEDDDFDF